MSSTTRDADGSRVGADHGAIPEIVDWLIAALLAIGGLALALGGSAILWVSDENAIAEAIAAGVAEGTVESDVLDPGELTAVATETAFWLGLGLLLTGLGMVVAGVLYVVARRRVRRSGPDRNRRGLLLGNAILGAVVTGLLSFIPVSPILGGAVSGYVHRKQASGVTTVGALSGLFAALPLVAIMIFLTVGLTSGFASAGVGGVGIVVVFAMVIAMLVLLVFSVGLGGIGGYLADAIAGDDGPPETTVDSQGEDDSTM